MKKITTEIFNKKHMLFYKKTIAVSLAFLILFNLNVQAFISIDQLAPREIQEEILAALEEANIQTKTPQEFLAELEKQLDEAAKDNNNTTKNNDDKTKKLTQAEYIDLYNTNINNQYNSYLEQIEAEAQAALAAFDEEAKKALDEQKALLAAKTSSPSLNLKVPSNDKLFNKNNNLLNPVKENLKLDTSNYQTYAYQTQQLNTLTPQQSTLKELEAAIAQQREEYTQEVNTWKENILSDLQKEHKKFLAGSQSSYNTYSKEYNAKLKEFYSSLVKEIIENYKKTTDLESKKKFVSILFFLTSIKSPEIDRNDFIKGEDRDFILNALRGNFSVKGNACAGSVKTTYTDNGTWGSAALGGSPSAGKMYDNSANKTAFFEFTDKEKCDLAISSMLPYANLNGDAYAITNFIRQYYNSPTFGMMLQIAVKSLLLTNNKGDEALTKFIDESMALENKVRNDKGNLWQKLDIVTFEGFSNNQVFDGKYCNHNLCSAADGGKDNPNAWEEVAYMLAEANKTNLLNKAISQCKVVATKNYYQHMECQGIYPFLFGALISKPELANKIKGIRPFQEVTGQTLDEYGRSHYVTAEEVKENKAKNDKFDILSKHTQAEWIAAYLVKQSFEDVHPNQQLRMNNLVAASKVLNPKNKFVHIDKNSKDYKRNLRHYNEKLVLLSITSYADFLVALICTKDLIRFGILSIMKVKNLAKFAIALRAYKSLPNSFAKAVKLTRLLESCKFSPKSVARMNKFKKFNANPLHFTSSAVVARMGGESQALIGSVSGRITGAKGDVLVGTQEYLRPISGSYKGKIVLKQGSLGGNYVVGGANALKTTPEPQLSFKDTFKKVFHDIKYNFALSPWLKGDPKEVTNLDVSNLSIELLDTNDKPIKIESMHINKDSGVLYVNGEMFKTFKASLREDQLEIINKLIKDHNINIGIDGFYVKPLWSETFTKGEKVASRWKNSEMVNIYDLNGNVVMKLGLNRGYKQDLALLNRLGIMDPEKVAKWTRKAERRAKKGKTTKPMETLANQARLVYTNGALFIEEGGNLTRLEGLTGLSLPKTAILNMSKGHQVEFLNALFSMPSKTENAAPLKFKTTPSKIGWVYLTQALSYSAASSSLMMTMEKAPFNFTPTSSVIIGLFLPYIWSFASPFMAPLVKMWGAKPVFLLSMGVAGAGLLNACFNGYNYNATNEYTDKKWAIFFHRLKTQTDEDGNITYELRKKTLPAWPLFVASGACGLSAAGIRATSNILLKGYELNTRTMNKSMLWKNVGGLAFTATPFFFNRLSPKDVKADFSATYPLLVGLTAAAALGIGLKMPKMNIPGYRPKSADFFSKPWKLLFTKEIAPYTIGMMGVCSLEGYVYFKGVNALARDTFEYKLQPEDAKFAASIFTALPQLLLRRSSPRQAFFGRGLFNSALLATGGTLLMAIPSNHLSVGENAVVGGIAGIALGLGTAQVYQYSQKLVLKQAKMMPGAPEKDAIILYSMSNLGLVLPAVFAMSADDRKANLNESEFEATRNTFYWPLMFYAAGMSAMADAERGFKIFPAIVAPTLRYSLEGIALKKTINKGWPEKLRLKTPTLENLNTPVIQPVKLGNLDLQVPQYNIAAPSEQTVQTEEQESNIEEEEEEDIDIQE